MNSSEWLDLKCRQLVVPEDSKEYQEVRGALNAVEECIIRSETIRVAERYPCGSFEKSTMLPGRKEADLVIVLADPPTDRTLETLQQVLIQGLRRAHYDVPLREPASISYKAVQLEFANGVKVDVLPVAKEGRTPPGPSVPRKLRVALSGREHVQWFKREAHQSTILQAVRALKHFREFNPEWKDLYSFAIEVLAVELLVPYKHEGLVACFRRVLDEVSRGYLLNGRRLFDPALPGNDLLADLDEAARQQITKAAQRAVRWVDEGQWTEVFPPQDRRPPLAAANLGGKPLA